MYKSILLKIIAIISIIFGVPAIKYLFELIYFLSNLNLNYYYKTVLMMIGMILVIGVLFLFLIFIIFCIIYSPNKKNKSQKINNIDQKINELILLGCKLPFIESYTHTGKDMYKIYNPYTEYGSEKFVLCPIEEGFSNALDEAIKTIKKCKSEYNYMKK